MEKRDLAALVNRAKKGDKASFAKLYSHFAHNIYYFALRITKSTHDADDVVQDTMLSLYNKLSTLKDPSAVSSFVNTTAYNFSLMLLRKRKDFLTDESDFFEDSRVEGNNEFIPESYLEEKELREEVIKILDNLPDAQRATLLLHYYEGLSTVEISKLLQLSEEAVRGRLFRGRESVRKAIASNGVKGAVLTTMSLPILSQILDLESKAAFSSSIQASNWAVVASKMGFTSKEIAATTKFASANFEASLSAGTTAPIAGAVSAKAVIATVLTVGIATAGVILVSQNNIPAESNVQQSIVSTDIQSMESISGEEVVAFDSEETSFAENPTALPAEENSGTAQTPVAIPAEANTASEVALQRENVLPLKYPIGSTVTLEKIIAGAKISAPEGVEIVATHLETVDTSKVGEYIVYLQGKNDLELSTALVVIILID